MRRLIVIFIFIGFISSCTKEIQLKEEYIKPKLVGYSLFNPDSTWRLNLSKSASIFTQDSTYPILGANVSIEDSDGNLIETLNGSSYAINDDFNLNNYEGELYPEKNKSYTITVEANGYEGISATSKIPPNFLCVVDTNIVFEEYENKMEFNIEILDNIYEEEFYMVQVKSRTTYSNGTENTSSLYLKTKDLNIERIGDGIDLEADYNGFSFLLRDETFNGNNYEFKITADLYFQYGGYQYEDFNDTLVPVYLKLDLNLYSVAEPYFLNFLSNEKNNNTGGDPFSTPVRIYSNFENGLGLFAGYNLQTYEFDVSHLIDFEK